MAAIRYQHYDFFVGVYPNDPATLRAIQGVQAAHSNIFVATCGHSGPTSKADCLNSIYRSMLAHEQERGIRFEVVITHDAEDLIHPESLRLINYFAQTYDMVQVPVLALPTPAREWTHGLYCDDFAEFQSKDIPARQFLGGFIPSNGVGTGYSRAILEKLVHRVRAIYSSPPALPRITRTAIASTGWGDGSYSFRFTAGTTAWSQPASIFHGR